MTIAEAQDEGVGLAEFLGFFAWLTLFYFATSFLLVAGFLIVMGLPGLIPLLVGAAREDFWQRIYWLPAVFAVFNASFVHTPSFATFYRARFPAIGLGHALLLILLSGVTFWAGLWLIDQAFSMGMLSTLPSVTILTLPFLFAAVSIVTGMANAGLHRRFYRAYRLEGGWVDRWHQRDVRLILGDRAWRRYYEWLWGHPPPN